MTQGRASVEAGGETPDASRPQASPERFGGSGVAVSVATALAASLSFYRLGSQSLWLDEGVSAIVAGDDLKHVLSWGAWAEPNHGLYYLLLHFVTWVGESEWVLRSLSAVVFIGTVPVLYLLAKRLLGRPVAVAASFLFALNAFVVAYSQEARPYALAVFLTTLCSLMFVRAITEPSGLRWLMYVVTAVLAIHAHPFAAFVVVAHACSLAFRSRETVPERGSIVAFSAIGMLSVPLIVLLLRSGSDRIAWIEETTLENVIDVVSDLVGRGGLPLLLAYAGLLALAVPSLRRAWRSTSEGSARWAYALPLLWLVVPVITAIAISIVQPVLVSRYLIICVPAISIIGAVGLVGVRRRAVQVAVSGVVALFAGLALGSWYAEEKEGWRAATAMVLADARQGDAIVFHPDYLRRPFAYYVMRTPDGIQRVPERTSPPVSWTRGLPLTGPKEPIERFLAGSDRPTRVWLFQRTGNVDPLQIEEGRRVVRALRATYASVDHIRFPGILVLLFS